MLRSFLSISFHTCYILCVFTIRQHYRAFGSTINAAKDSELFSQTICTLSLYYIVLHFCIPESRDGQKTPVRGDNVLI